MPERACLILSEDVLNKRHFAGIFSKLSYVSILDERSFTVSLLLSIEKLIKGLVGPIPSDSKTKFQNLRDYVGQWPGDAQIRSRALALLTSLEQQSPKSILEKLGKAGIVSSEESKSWLTLRPKVAHGNLVNVTEKDASLHRGRLMTMFHRLILRTIGYRGVITDFSGAQLQCIKFDWS